MPVWVISIIYVPLLWFGADASLSFVGSSVLRQAKVFILQPVCICPPLAVSAYGALMLPFPLFPVPCSCSLFLSTVHVPPGNLAVHCCLGVLFGRGRLTVRLSEEFVLPLRVTSLFYF